MARYYNAATGAFWSQDPGSISTADSKNPTSWNRYAFVNGDPINFRDRTGLYVDLDGADDTDYGDDGGCDDFTTKYQASPSPCETFGGGDPPPQRASAPAPPEIDCFAQLKDRPVNDPNAAKFHAVHTFWWVQGDVNGQAVQYIISAGPSKRQSGTQYLNVSVTKGDNNGSGDGSGANTAWSSGLSWINCDQVDALIAAAQNWQSNYNNTIQYNAVGVLGFGGPNSNSAAHYFGTVSGFSPNPPTTAYG